MNKHFSVPQPDSTDGSTTVGDTSLRTANEEEHLGPFPLPPPLAAVKNDDELAALRRELAQERLELAEKDREIQFLRSALNARKRANDYRLPALFSASPSKLRASAVLEVLDSSVTTCVGHPWALKALAMFYENPESKFMDVAKQVLDVRMRKALARDDVGLYSRAEPDCEEFHSAVVSALLQRHLGSKDRNWYHQLPVPPRRESGYAGTVCSVSVRSGNRSSAVELPCAVIEYGFTDQGRDKLSQICGHVLHLSHTMEQTVIGHGLALASVQWAMGHKDDRISLRVHGFPPISADNGHFSTMTVWEGKVDEKVLAAALAICYRFGDLMTKAFTTKVEWIRHGRNFAVDGNGNAFKIYDYRSCVRGGDNPPSARRTHEHHKLLPGSRLIEPRGVSHLDVVCYKYIEGIHVATTVQHLRAAASSLLSLHENENICHADIRLANIVFTPDGSAHLIDFDFSGAPNSATYPDGFADKLEDDERHPDARSGAYVQKEHDLFSFASCMLLHECDREFQQTWQRLAELVRNEKLAQFIDESEQYSSQALCCSKKLQECLASGSPSRKPIKKRKLSLHQQ